MRIESMIHDLQQLNSQMKTIQAYVYANLGKVNNFTMTDEECFKKCNIEFALFEQRLQDMLLELKTESKS